MLYLDYAATYPVLPGVKDVLVEAITNDFANSSSAHKLGKGVAKKVDIARSTVLSSLGLNSKKFKDKIVFTASATESNNIMINGLNVRTGEKAFVCEADHPSVTAPVHNLKDRGVEVVRIPVLNNGTIDTESFINLIDEKAKLVVLSHVNNQTGIINDIETIALKIKNKFPRVYIHLDAAQSFGKYFIDLNKIKVDSIAISGHKIGAPKGIACLYIKDKVTVRPIMLGGGQEFGIRPSTVAVPLIMAFEKAVSEWSDRKDKDYTYVKDLNKQVRDGLEKIPTIRLPYNHENCSPYILTFILPGISSDIFLRHLEQKDIYISSSSACSSRVKGDNSVFTALGIPKNEHKFVLRVSFSSDISLENAEFFIESMTETYNELKRYIR